MELIRFSYSGTIPQQYNKVYEEIKADYELFITTVQSTFDKFVHIENLKDFALQVKPYPFASQLLSMKKENILQVSKLVAQREVKVASLNVWIQTAIKYYKRHNP